jgi:hypothetical protein
MRMERFGHDAIDPVGENVIRRSSDCFSHRDCAFPAPVEFTEGRNDLPETIRPARLAGNAARRFGLEVSK